jgi:DNA-binding transcriptional MerR regulator
MPGIVKRRRPKAKKRNAFEPPRYPLLKNSLDSGISSELYNPSLMSAPSKMSYLRAGELARAAGVSTDTLRHYERKGVLSKPHRSRNGYREYPTEALARVLLVRRALAFGFTLDELASVLRARERGGAPCREVRTLAAAKLAGVEARLRELAILRDELRATLEEWDSRLSKTAKGGRAGLLESLSDSRQPNDKHNTASAASWRRRKRRKDKNE